MRQYCAEWLRGKTHSRQDGTSTRYTGSIGRFVTLLGDKADRPISAVTPLDCQRFYDALQEEKLAPATLVVEMKTIATLFNAARRIGLVPTNPATAVELPERIRQVKRKTFTPKQVQMLLDGVSAAAATATKRGDGEAATSFLEWRTAILLG